MRFGFLELIPKKKPEPVRANNATRVLIFPPGNTVCFTGRGFANTQHYSREEISLVAYRAGYKISDTVRRGVDILVCPKGFSSSKVATAKKIGCEIMEYQEFVDIAAYWRMKRG